MPFTALAGMAFLFLPIQGAKAMPSETPEVASAFEADDPFDLHLGIDYSFQYKHAAIIREWGRGNETLWARDLWYQRVQQVLTPSLEIGLCRELSAYLQLPITLYDRQIYEFDQRNTDNCSYPDPKNPSRPSNCVNRGNSSTLRDSILPLHGYDATSPQYAFTSYTGVDTTRIMTAPIRRGIDQLHAGLKLAVLDQNKKPHFPTWILGLEGRFAIGARMQLRKSRQKHPSSNLTVGRKIHEVGFWTSLRRRMPFVEPYASAYFRYAIAAKGSLFDERGPSSQIQRPQSQAGAAFGFELVPWVSAQRDFKVSIDVRATLGHHFRGHGYSEIWELSADSPALVGKDPNTAGACSLRASLQHAGTHFLDPSSYLETANQAPNSGQCERFSGITAIQAYTDLGGRAALTLQLGSLTRLSLGANVYGSTTHRVSGQYHRIGTAQRAPSYRAVIDRAGRRYAVDDVLQLRAFSSLQLLF